MTLSQLKARLTRAKKAGPESVVKAVEYAVEVFNKSCWPDCWSMWQRELLDATHTLRAQRKFEEAKKAESLLERLFR